MKIWVWLAAAGLVSLLLLGACDSNDTELHGDATTVEPPGNVVTKDFDFANFTSVEAANAFAVEISQSDAFGVTVRIDDSLEDRLDVSLEGNTLRLRLKGGLNIEGDITLEATITMPVLEGLQLSGAASADLSGITSTAKVDMVLSGASRLAGDVQALDRGIDASGASTVQLEGVAASMSIDGSGASNLDLADFAAETAEVTLSGASEATVNVRNRIDAVDVSGASRLYHLGDPELGDVKNSGASTVEAVDD